MTCRYVFFAGIAELSVLGEKIRQEIWIGIEAGDDVDLKKFSIDHGYFLIPAEHYTAAELRAIGVTKFVTIDGLDDAEPS